METAHKAVISMVLAAVIAISVVVLGFTLTGSRSNSSAAPNMPVSQNAPTPTTSPTASTTPSSSATNSPSARPSPTPTTTLPVFSTLQTSSVNGSFELTLSVEKTVHSPREPVNVTLALTNISDQTVNFTHTAFDFDFFVENASGGKIYQWSIGQAFPMWAMIKQLPPGESETATYTWPQTSNSNFPSVTAQVPAGTYYIVGETPDKAAGLQTPPLEIVIVDS